VTKEEATRDTESLMEFHLTIYNIPPPLHYGHRNQDRFPTTWDLFYQIYIYIYIYIYALAIFVFCVPKG
jgi:hypothetical protein